MVPLGYDKHDPRPSLPAGLKLWVMGFNCTRLPARLARDEDGGLLVASTVGWVGAGVPVTVEYDDGFYTDALCLVSRLKDYGGYANTTAVAAKKTGEKKRAKKPRIAEPEFFNPTEVCNGCSNPVIGDHQRHEFPVPRFLRRRSARREGSHAETRPRSPGPRRGR
jgi:hypothetical protein